MRRPIVAFAAMLLLVVRGVAAGAEPLRLQDALAAVETVAADAPRRDAILAASVRHPYVYWGNLRLELLAPEDALRINAMARLFDARLCDLAYAALNEKMAIAYGVAQRVAASGPTTSTAGSTAESLARLEAEARYLDLLAKRNAMQTQQRLTRSMLAQSLGQPDRLAEELADPEFDAAEEALPAFGALEQSLRSANPRLRALESLPQAKRSKLPAAQMDIGQELLRIYLEIESLQGAERTLVTKRTELADRRFDEERDHFERNQANDFSNAMAAIVDAKHEQRMWLYRLTLANARLGALLGRAFRIPSTVR
jgi:hypothetical protein